MIDQDGLTEHEAIAEMIEHDGAYLLEVEVEAKGMVYPMVPSGGCVSNIILGNGHSL